MRTASAKNWKARLAAGLLCFWAVFPAAAASPALEQALLVQAGHLATLRGVSLACPDIPAAADADAAWEKTKATLVATLRANWVSAATVKTIAESLDAVPAAPDCADEWLRGGAEQMAADWLGRVTAQLDGLGFSVVARPPQAADWEAIEAIVAEQAKAQGRLLECLAVRDPRFLPDEVNRWDSDLTKASLVLSAKGFDVEAIAALLSPATASSIWHPVTGEEATALKADCDTDMGWYDQWSMFNRASILAPIEELLK